MGRTRTVFIPNDLFTPEGVKVGVTGKDLVPRVRHK